MDDFYFSSKDNVFLVFKVYLIIFENYLIILWYFYYLGKNLFI